MSNFLVIFSTFVAIYVCEKLCGSENYCELHNVSCTNKNINASVINRPFIFLSNSKIIKQSFLRIIIGNHCQTIHKLFSNFIHINRLQSIRETVQTELLYLSQN